MEFNQNRLRFVHCEHLFKNAEEIKSYVRSVQYEHASLYGEPMIFKYGDEKDPSIVLAIGSVGEGKFVYDTETGDILNKTYFIDFSRLDSDVEAIKIEMEQDNKEYEKLTEIINNVVESCGFYEDGKYIVDLKDKILGEARSLYSANKMLSEYVISLEKKHNLKTKDSETIKFNLNKSENGIELGADVKLGTKIQNNMILDNIIIKQEDGLFANVEMGYDAESNKLSLIVNGEVKKEVSFPVESHVISGEYDEKIESLVLTLNNKIDINGELSDKIKIDLGKLIAEWTVLEESNTPIVLTKEPLKKGEEVHTGIYDFQDILKADIRILDKTIKPNNILEKDSSGKYLFVDGVASNISYNRNNEKITVQEAIEEKISKSDYSKQQDSIITYREDGLFSYIDVSYDSNKNSLIFKKSDTEGNIITHEYQLNSMQLINTAYWDATKEEIVISYIDAKNQPQELRIPLKIVVDEFDVDNSDATVTLTIVRNPNGQDTIKADVNIAKDEFNILQDLGHSLYVKGTADNIKMINKSLGENVESAINTLNINTQYALGEESRLRDESDRKLQNAINEEIIRAKQAEQEIVTKLESDGSTTSGLKSLLDKEIERAENSERELREQISNEIERSRVEDVNLKDLINNKSIELSDKDNELSNELLKEINRAKTEEIRISNELQTEINRVSVIDNRLTSDLANEVKRSSEEDSYLKQSLLGEATRATNAEKELEVKIEKEVSERKAAINDIVLTINELKNNDDNSKTYTDTEILIEKNRAEGVEATLFEAIDDEKVRATNEETIILNKLADEIKRSTDYDISLDETLSHEIKRSTEKDDELLDLIMHVNEDSLIDTIESGTVVLTKAKASKGSTLRADVKVSTKSDNILTSGDEPLYASVDVRYDNLTHEIILSRSGLADKAIKLGEGSLIEKMYYDASTKELVILYEDTKGETFEVRVDVTQMFKPILVDNTSHNVILSIQDGESYVLSADLDIKNIIDNTDKSVKLSVNEDGKLSAEANLSELEDNILIVDNEYNLYVKGTADNIKMLNDKYGETVEKSIENLGEKIDSFEKGTYDDSYLREEINKLKSKTSINVEDSNTIDLSFTSTDDSSKLKADVKLSNDPSNLLKDSNGLLFDGNIDYLINRHLQLNRNETIFNNKVEALDYLNNQENLEDKKDGEPILIRYYDENGDVQTILAIVTDDGNKKTINTVIGGGDYEFVSDELHNVKFEIQEVNGKKRILANVDIYDCGTFGNN